MMRQLHYAGHQDAASILWRHACLSEPDPVMMAGGSASVPAQVLGPAMDPESHQVLSRIDNLSQDIEYLVVMLSNIDLLQTCGDTPVKACPARSEQPHPSLQLHEVEVHPLTPTICRCEGLPPAAEPREKVHYHSCPASFRPQEVLEEETAMTSSSSTLGTLDTISTLEPPTDTRTPQSARGSLQARQRPHDGALDSYLGRSRAAARRKPLNLSIAISKVPELRAEPVSPKVVPRAHEVWGPRAKLRSLEAEPAQRSADAIKERIENRLSQMFGDLQVKGPKMRRKFKSVQ